jgi:hypothetical protein
MRRKGASDPPADPQYFPFLKPEITLPRGIFSNGEKQNWK